MVKKRLLRLICLSNNYINFGLLSEKISNENITTMTNYA